MNLTTLTLSDIDTLAAVLAFDPGETTGWCLMAVKPEDLTTQAHPLDKVIEHLEYGQIDGRGIGENAAADNIVTLAASHSNAAIVVEDFILDFGQATSDRHTLSPVRINAIVNYEMHKMGRNVIVQGRSGVKTTCNDTRLKHWGLYDSHSGAHARDAIRHAFFWLRTCRGDTVAAAEARWKAWPHLYDDPYARVRNIDKTKRKREPGERI